MKTMKKTMLVMPVLVLLCLLAMPSMTYANCTKGHSFNGQFVVSKKPTCTENGLEVGKCTRCGKVVSKKKIKALGHSKAKKWSVIKNATCTENGIKIKRCTRCKKTLSVSVQKATGHNWVVKSKKPTTKSTGYYIRKCSKCGKKSDDKKYAKVKFTFGNHSPSNHIYNGYEFHANGSLTEDIQKCCGAVVYKNGKATDRYEAAISLKCNYKLVIECDGSYVNLLNQTKNTTKKAKNKITLGNDSLGLLLYCDSIPKTDKRANRQCTVKIKDEFGNVLKTLKIKQRNDFTYNGSNKENHKKSVKSIVNLVGANNAKRENASGNCSADYMKKVLNGDEISNKVVTCFSGVEKHRNELIVACSYVRDGINVKVDYMTLTLKRIEDQYEKYDKAVGLVVTKAHNMSIATGTNTEIISISEKMTKSEAKLANNKQKVMMVVNGTSTAIGLFPNPFSKGAAALFTICNTAAAQMIGHLVEKKAEYVQYRTGICLKKGNTLSKKGNEVYAYTLAKGVKYTYNLRFKTGKYAKTWTKSGKF